METQSLEIWGGLACFTRPELKVERFSYPVITPSAARAIFEAIYWKPQFRWQVTRIEIMEPVRYIALRRNEVQDRAPSNDVILRWMDGREQPKPIAAGAGAESNTQRQTMALKDVRYRLYAQIKPWPEMSSELAGMVAQFRRRANRGQCIYQPYLGCREFPAYFELLEGTPANAPLNFDQHLGWMLYDVFDLSRRCTQFDKPTISVFDATIRAGVLEVPDYSSPAVRKPGAPINA